MKSPAFGYVSGAGLLFLFRKCSQNGINRRKVCMSSGFSPGERLYRAVFSGVSAVMMKRISFLFRSSVVE